MVATANLKSTAKDLFLAPIYIYQGRKVKRDTIRLPEPEGIRYGQVKLMDSTKSSSADAYVDTGTGTDTSTDQGTLKIMVVGDSAAAGVGSQTQQQALAGRLIPALQQQALVNETFAAQFDELSWSVQATTGHTSFDILRRLYILPKPSQPIDVMVLSVGVNDTTANVAVDKWQQQIQEIIAIAKRKFAVRVLIFSSLPPMAQMPALPAPLGNFIGAKASKLDKVLCDICAEYQGVSYMATDFPRMIAEHSNGTPIDIAVMFASDGFHPSSLMYGYWAQQLAELITELLTTEQGA